MMGYQLKWLAGLAAVRGSLACCFRPVFPVFMRHAGGRGGISGRGIKGRDVNQHKRFQFLGRLISDGKTANSRGGAAAGGGGCRRSPAAPLSSVTGQDTGHECVPKSRHPIPFPGQLTPSVARKTASSCAERVSIVRTPISNRSRAPLGRCC